MNKKKVDQFKKTSNIVIAVGSCFVPFRLDKFLACLKMAGLAVDYPMIGTSVRIVSRNVYCLLADRLDELLEAWVGDAGD